MVTDNVEKRRFELQIGAHTAFSNYRRAGGVVTFLHTEVPEVIAHHGIGTTLVQGALDLVRQSGEKVVARCPFVAAYIAKHPEYQDLLSN